MEEDHLLGQIIRLLQDESQSNDHRIKEYLRRYRSLEKHTRVNAEKCSHLFSLVGCERLSHLQQHVLPVISRAEDFDPWMHQMENHSPDTLGELIDSAVNLALTSSFSAVRAASAKLVKVLARRAAECKSCERDAGPSLQLPQAIACLQPSAVVVESLVERS